MVSSVATAWAFADWLTDTATFYGRTASTGRSTTVLQTGVPCHVAYAAFTDAAGNDRAQLASARTLVWTQDYEPPLDVQIELNGDGRRWNIRAGSLRHVQQPDGGLARWECDLEGTGRPPTTPR